MTSNKKKGQEITGPNISKSETAHLRVAHHALHHGVAHGLLDELRVLREHLELARHLRVGRRHLLNHRVVQHLQEMAKNSSKSILRSIRNEGKIHNRAIQKEI